MLPKLEVAELFLPWTVAQSANKCTVSSFRSEALSEQAHFSAYWSQVDWRDVLFRALTI